MNDVKTALLVVDMQNAYFEDEPLRSVQTVLTEKCNGLITAALAHSVPVINVRTEHRHDKSTWTLNMLESNKGFLLSGTAETKVLSDLHIEGSLEIIKTRDSSFVGTDLVQLLARQSATSVVLCVVSTHTCIAATAIDAYARNVDVIFAEDAIASHRPELHDITLESLCREYRLHCFDNVVIESKIESGDLSPPRGYLPGS